MASQTERVETSGMLVCKRRCLLPLVGSMKDKDSRGHAGGQRANSQQDTPMAVKNQDLYFPTRYMATQSHS